jgi:hypothetical protein
MNMVRKEVMTIYWVEHPGMEVDLMDIRLLYIDSDGDKIEIESDDDLYVTVLEHANKLNGKNLRIISPMVKKKGLQDPGVTQDAETVKVPQAAGGQTEPVSTSKAGEHPVASATAPQGAGGQTEPVSTSKVGEEADAATPVASASASQTMGTPTQPENERTRKGEAENTTTSSNPPPLGEAMNSAVASLVMASRSATIALMGHDEEGSLDGSLLLRLAEVTSATIALCNYVRDVSDAPQLSSSVKDKITTLESAPMVSKTVSAPRFTTSPSPLREIPFIHGRHKCVKCLANPIMGKRYRLTNVEGCHFCEACFGKTTSSILDFALEEIGTYSFVGFSRSHQQFDPSNCWFQRVIAPFRSAGVFNMRPLSKRPLKPRWQRKFGVSKKIK